MIKKLMRKIGYRNTRNSDTKLVFEKHEHEHIIGICYTPKGEICDFYIYKFHRKITCQQDIENTMAAYKLLRSDLEKLRNVN